jgi:hypothetical protein
MGITRLSAELIFREHQRKKLPDTVHLLGRQTVYLTLDQACGYLRRAGIEPAQTSIELDTQTTGAREAQLQYISDRTFFGLMGVRNVLAIDYTAYEGADIILDLTKPIPSSHHGTIDFLYGGSVLDNIFDPATYIRNVSDLLRPGGRLIEHDIISQHQHPYCLVSPAWMFDYFAFNGYGSCSIYVCESAYSGFHHIYGLRPPADDIISDFGPSRGSIPISMIVIAEKDNASSSDVIPIQDVYRSDNDGAVYRAKLLRLIDESDKFCKFAVPTARELAQLSIRASRSFQYLGVLHHSMESRGLQNAEPPPSGLRVLQATYGGNCIEGTLTKSAISAVYSGNVTDILACIFNGLNDYTWQVNVSILGDPAPERSKDLEVYYSNLSDSFPRLRRIYIPAEAHGQLLTLPSPAD